jgi:hypothetical protein
MPNQDEFVAPTPNAFDDSTFNATLEQEARQAAAQMLSAQVQFDIEQGQPDPLVHAPEQTQIAYLMYLRQAREARGLRVGNAMADVASVARPDGQETAENPLTGLAKGVQAGAMRVGALVKSPFVPEEETITDLAAAGQRGGDTNGMLARGGSLIGQTATELAPMVAAGMVSGGIAPAAALPTMATAAGLQSGAPEYFERRGQGFDTEEAAKIAAAKGMTTAAITALFGMTGVEALARPLTQAAVRKGFAEYLSMVGKGAGKEAVEEASDEAMQAFYDAKLAGDNVTAAEFIERVGMAAGLGGLFGAAGETGAALREHFSMPAPDAAGAPAAPVPAKLAVDAKLATPPAAAEAPAARAINEGNLRVAARKLYSGELKADQLTPDQAGQLAATLRARAGKTPDKATLELIQALDAASPKSALPAGTAAPQPVAPVPVAPEPSPTKQVAAGVKELAAAMREATAALKAARPKKSPATAPAVAPSTPPVAAPTDAVNPLEVSRAVPAQEVVEEARPQGQSQGQGQEGVRPLRQEEVTEAAPAVGGDVDADARGANQFEAALKSGPVALARHARAVGARIPEPELQAQIDGLTAEAENRITKSGADPKKAAVIRQRFAEKASELRANWAAALTEDQISRTVEALKGTTGLPAQVAAKLMARTPTPTPVVPKPVGERVPGVLPKAEPDPTPPSLKAADVLPAGKPAPPAPEPKPAAPREPVPPAPVSQPVLGQGGVVQETSLPAADAGIRPFGISEDPESPAFTGAIRERIAEKIRLKGRGDADKGTTADLAQELRYTSDEMSAAVRAAAGIKPDEAIRTDDPRMAAAKAKLPDIVRSRPAGSAPVRVRMGWRKGEDALLYEAPNAWSKLLDEYLGLHQRHGSVAKQEATVENRRLDLTDAETKYDAAVREGEPADVVRAWKAKADRANAAHEKSRKELARRQGSTKALTDVERKRIHALSNGIRSHFAEGLAKQMGDYLVAQPGSERRTVAKRFEDALERGLTGMDQDLAKIIGADELVDPGSLRGVNSRLYLAESIDKPGQFMLVAPDPKTAGSYVPLSVHGDAITTFPRSRLERPSADTRQDAAGERVIQGKSIGDLRAGMDTEGNVTPFVTDDIAALIDVAKHFDLELPAAKIAREKLDWMMQNGFGVDMKGDQFKLGQTDLDSPTEGSAKATTGVQADLNPQSWENAETYIGRILLSETGENVDSNGFYIGKRAPIAEVDAALTKLEGGRQVMRQLIDLKIIKKAGGFYKTDDMRHHYRRTPAASTTAQESNPTIENVMSAEQQTIRAATLFDLDVRVGARHGIELPPEISGVYDMNARAIALGQYDLPSLFHELFHDLTVAHIGRTSSPMPVVQNELLAAAKAGKQPPLLSEGAAELGAMYVRDPVAVRAQYPAAMAWLDTVMQSEGISARVQSVIDEHQKWLKAPGPVKAKASIVARSTYEKRGKESKVGSWWWRAAWQAYSAVFDQNAYLRAVQKRVMGAPQDIYDSAYDHKMMEAGWAAAGADNFWNGFVLDPGTNTRTAGFAGVLESAKAKGIVAEKFNDWVSYMEAMSVFEGSPRLRRRVFAQMKMDETDYGNWGIPGNTLDPFHSLDEIRIENARMMADWEARKVLNAAAGKPAPLKPVPYKVEDPSPGARGEEAAPTNFTEDQLRALAERIQPHKLDSTDGYHAITENWRAAVNGFDSWQVSNGLMTSADQRLHLEKNYHVPRRTETESSLRTKVKGGGDADIINPFEMTFDKVMTAHYRHYSEQAPRALLRAGVDARAARAQAGTERTSEENISDIVSFTSMEEAVGNYARLKDQIKNQDQKSPVVDQYVVVSLDERTLDSLLSAGLIDPFKYKNPNVLLGTHIAYLVRDPAIRKALGDPSLPWTASLPWLLRAPANMVRKLATTFNPEFWVKNPIRDMFHAAIQTGAGRNPLRVAKTTVEGLMDAYTHASKIVSNRATTDASYAAFVHSGVSSSSLMADMHNVTNVLSNHDLSKVLGQLGADKPGFGWLRKPFDLMHRVADTSEAFNRAGEFRRAIGDGLAKANVKSMSALNRRQAESILLQAARHAQEVTVNFRRIGGSPLARWANELIPFFNPALQGTTRGLKAMVGAKRYQGETIGSRVVNGLTVYTILALPMLLQHLLLNQDDDTLRDYQEISDSERTLYYHLPIGKTESGRTWFAKIPKPQGVFAAVSMAMQRGMEDDPRTWSEIGQDTFAQVTPQAVIPTILQLGVEMFGAAHQRVGGLGNRDTIPHALQGVDAESQDTPWTSPTAYALSTALRGMGWDSASPMVVENLIRGYTGGLGSLALDMPTALMDTFGASDRASYSPGQYPVARVFISRNPSFSSRSITRMYDLLNVLNGQDQTMKAETKKVEEGRLDADEMVKTVLTDRPAISFGSEVSNDPAILNLRSEMAKARVLWENINRDKKLTPVERRIKMDELVELIVDASRATYQAVTDTAKDMKIPLEVPRR